MISMRWRKHDKTTGKPMILVRSFCLVLNKLLKLQGFSGAVYVQNGQTEKSRKSLKSLDKIQFLGGSLKSPYKGWGFQTTETRWNQFSFESGLA